MNFPLMISSVNGTKSGFPNRNTDLVTFTKEILNGKLHLLQSVMQIKSLISVLQPNKKTFLFKRAAKLYSTHYLCVIIILFN